MRLKKTQPLKERHKTADILYSIGGLISYDLLQQQGEKLESKLSNHFINAVSQAVLKFMI